MAEASDHPEDPPTVIVDVPSPSWLPVAGGLLVVGGLLLRCFARWLAWPAEWRYSGDRANTEWAYREALYADLGLAALAFGLSLVWLAIARRTRSCT
jgi:hypothetical protein